jgi:SAM-dependent methyltransferase
VIDPISREYVEEGLVPECCSGIVFIDAKGEEIPLPSGYADLIINENCLDHVTDPRAVVREMVRLLKPGGLLWFFVDLSNHVDQMHPHAMNEKKVRRLLIEEGGFTVLREEISSHKAHPKAYGGFRALLQRGSPMPQRGGLAEPAAQPTEVHVRGWPHTNGAVSGDASANGHAGAAETAQPDAPAVH